MNKLTHPKYRADIDGLRAIAVLLVVFFHAGLGKGGFIGVDIFFVISGFLISTIIFDNLDSGRFSFWQFYERRIRRIFPALLIVLVFTLVFGWFTLFADEYKHLGNHIFRSSYFFSNFTLLNESGYFDNDSETKPLLHLWSLAIEEQFYIIWPLLLLGISKLKDWKWLSCKKKLAFLAMTIFILLTSFCFSIFEIYHNKSAAFYLPQSRFWELLTGSILAYLTFYKKDLLKFNGDRNIYSNLISIVGALLIAVGVAFITKQKSFPGALALLPTIGAFLIIFAGQHAWLNRTILQNKILVWFGLISFPLYLWHWPLLSFARIVESEKPAAIIRIIAVIVSIFLAWLTYKFIERPLRFGGSAKIKVTALIITMVGIGFAGYLVYFKDGFKSRKSIESYKVSDDDLITPELTRKSDNSCDKFGFGKNIVCLINSTQPEFLIIGDSHAMSLNSAAYLHKSNLKTILISQHDCRPFEKYVEGSQNYCTQIAIDSKIAVTKFKSIKTVIINTFYPDKNGFKRLNLRNINDPNSKESQQDMFVNGYKDLIKDLISAEKNVVFIIDNPRLEHDPKRCLARPLRSKPDDCKIDKKVILERQYLYRQKILEIQKAIPELKIFDSLDAFCDKDFCYFKDDKNIFYFDKHHLSVSGSKKLLDGYLQN